ncbi:MAG: class I SAM-dependent methyltransferase [Deltaproteobacteria bacterium]|nr:class I SAM-dependent methyltransferase [Deltaproteobacteria bacterium]
MRPAEARWIAARLAALPRDRISPLLNLGSSTGETREVRQPHIDALIFAPLRAAGVEIIHSDLKQAPGVDIAGDLLDPAVQTQLRARRPRAALSSNLLEHVRSPAVFARAMASLVEPRGLVLVTVPRSYPYHADPIDTGFRPTPTELAALFPDCALVHGEVVADSTYGEELWRQGRNGLRKGVRTLLGALRPHGDVARAQRDRLRWMLRPFTTTCIVLETAARS